MVRKRRKLAGKSHRCKIKVKGTALEILKGEIKEEVAQSSDCVFMGNIHFNSYVHVGRVLREAHPVVCVRCHRARLSLGARASLRVRFVLASLLSNIVIENGLIFTADLS